MRDVCELLCIAQRRPHPQDHGAGNSCKKRSSDNGSLGCVNQSRFLERQHGDKHRSIFTPAFAKANSGITTNAEKLCNPCSSLRTGAVTAPLARSSANTVSCCPLLVKTTKSPVSVRSNLSSSERACLENSTAFMRECVGMVKASATPAIVACTPETCTKHHRTTPTSRYGHRRRIPIRLNPINTSSVTAAPPSALQTIACE